MGFRRVPCMTCPGTTIVRAGAGGGMKTGRCSACIRQRNRANQHRQRGRKWTTDHALLVQIRNDLTAAGRADASLFEAYEAYGVAPTHLHRDKRAHMMATFLLGEAISRIVAKKHALRFIEQPTRGL